MKRKQGIFIVILFSILIGVAVGVTDAAGRNVLTDDVYISSPRELQVLAEKVNEGNSYEHTRVVLTCDLDMSAVENFTPIGKWENDTGFCGVFDGNGHVIRNLTIIGEGENANMGLFGALGGIVCNLTIEDCYVRGNACGAICSIAMGEKAAIINCAVRRAVIDAEFSDTFGGQYFGERLNCIIDGQGAVEELNGELRELWREWGMLPLNLWTYGEEGAVLSTDRADFLQNIYLVVDDFYEVEIHPLYDEDTNRDIFCIPAFEGSREAMVCLEYLDGSLAQERIVLPETEKLVFEKNGESFEVAFMVSENTGTLLLDTGMDWGFDYLCESQDNELTADIRALDESGNQQYLGRIERIHGRGNDSWGQKKSSFGFKLAAAADILGLGQDEDFILHPGYRDYSLLTYQVVWDLCREMKWDNALSYRLVQLYVDGYYKGLYFLTEKVEAGTERINIVQNAKPDSGYVFEYDILDYEATDIRIETNQGSSYTFVSPGVPTMAQREYCLNLWNDYEEALYSEDGYNRKGRYYTEYADLESLAAQWLFYELNGEISIASSVYFYKNAEGTEDERIHAFSPWDVEHSFVNWNYARDSRMRETEKQFVNGFWLKMSSHEDFREELRRQWEERFLPALDKLLAEEAVANPEGVSSLEYYASHYAKASDVNEVLCGERHDIGVKADSIRSWLEVRIPYLSENLYREDFFTQ